MPIRPFSDFRQAFEIVATSSNAHSNNTGVEKVTQIRRATKVAFAETNTVIRRYLDLRAEIDGRGDPMAKRVPLAADTELEIVTIIPYTAEEDE